MRRRINEVMKRLNGTFNAQWFYIYHFLFIKLSLKMLLIYVQFFRIMILSTVSLKGSLCDLNRIHIILIIYLFSVCFFFFCCVNISNIKTFSSFRTFQFWYFSNLYLFSYLGFLATFWLKMNEGVFKMFINLYCFYSASFCYLYFCCIFVFAHLSAFLHLSFFSADLK